MDRATGAPFPQFAFDSFLTFGRDGTLAETTSNPNFQPGQRGPGHGSWAQTGRGTYEAFFQAFILLDSAGRVRGKQRVEAAIALADGIH